MKPRLLINLILALTPFILLQCIYQYYLFGDAFLPGYLKLWGNSHNLGFHVDPFGNIHTFWKGFFLQLYNLRLLNEYLFESLIPALWLLIPAIIKFDCRSKYLLGSFLIVPIGYIFYWHQDSFLGPRFLYESLAFLFPLLALSLVKIYKFCNLKSKLWLRFYYTSLGSILLTSLIFGIPSRLSLYKDGLRSMKLDLAKLAKIHSIDNSIIFISTSWGDRLISQMRAEGVSSTDTEILYRRADHCQLWLGLKKVQTKAITAKQYVSLAKSLIESNGLATKNPINKDPTLRLNPKFKLSKECLDELNYDLANDFGYTIYAPHLLNNHPSWNKGNMYVRDLREQNLKLLNQYREKKGFIYRAGKFYPL